MEEIGINLEELGDLIEEFPPKYSSVLKMQIHIVKLPDDFQFLELEDPKISD
jgi:hypothetical protein